MSEQHAKLARTTVKVLVSVTTMLAIGWALVTFGPDGEVQESHADVWNFGMFERSNTQKFARSLERLDHEPPRSYDVNGNKVFFSVRAANKRPMELVEEYQRTFVEEGLNTEQHGLQKKMTQRAKKAMGGQIIPLKMTRNVVTMGGAVIPDSPSSAEEWESIKEEYRTKSFNDVFVGYRHIQMDWDPKVRKTFVTASWSDEDFDIRRLSGATDDQVPEEKIVPLCPGCTRSIRWETDARDLPYTINVMLAPRPVDDMLQYYKNALVDEGWSVSGATPKTRDLGRARMAEFTRGEERIQISFMGTGPQATRVTAVQLQ